MIELTLLELGMLVGVFVGVSGCCCWLGAKCMQQECKCKLCQGLIQVESQLGQGRFGTVGFKDEA